MRCTYALTLVIVKLADNTNCVMYEVLLSSEVFVRYGIGSSSLLSDENHERK